MASKYPPPRPGTRSSLPPGTGMMRPGSRRVGTSYGQQAGTGVALTTQVRVAQRPVTREGMSGMKTGVPPGTAAGISRQVQDRSFWLGEMRSKQASIEAEIDRLRQEDEQIQRDNEMFAHMERRYDELEKKVLKQREYLADYNMCVEKYGVGDSIYEIEREKREVSERNKETKRDLDTLFRERALRQENIQEAEERVRSFQDRMEEKFSSEPEKKAAYQNLREENSRLATEISEQQEVLRRLLLETEELQAQMSSQADLTSAARLRGEVQDLQKRENELQGGSADKQEKSASEKDELLKKVKADNLHITSMISETSELKETIALYRDQISEMDKDITESDTAGKTEKMLHQRERMRELQVRDQEMQSFIDSFDDEMVRAQAKSKDLQEGIVGLLSHMSKGIHQKSNLPSLNQYQDMQKDLEFKEQQKEYAQSTQEQLRSQLADRKKEFDKILTLDEKLAKELSSIGKNMEDMKNEMERFGRMDDMRKEETRKKTEFEENKAQLKTQLEGLKKRVHVLGQEYDSSKRILEQSTIHQGMERMEQKIRFSEQNAFTMREYVQSKGHEINYEPKKNETLELISRINCAIIRTQDLNG